MHPILILGAFMGLSAFLKACTHAQPRKEDRKPTNEEALMAAGGIDAFVAEGAHPDSRFHIYSYRADWCRASRLHDASIAEVATVRGDLDYTPLDVEKIEGIWTPDRLPYTIVQYSDCPAVATFLGAAPPLIVDMLLQGLRQACEEAERSIPEKSPEGPKERPSKSKDEIWI